MLSLGLYPASQSKLVSLQAIRHVSYQILSTQCGEALARKCIQGHACVHSSIILIHMHHHQSPLTCFIACLLSFKWTMTNCFFSPCNCLLEASMGVGKLNRSLKADNDSAWAFHSINNTVIQAWTAIWNVLLNIPNPYIGLTR